MAPIIIRDVPEEVLRALRICATQHDRSAEAEIRSILEQADKPEGRLKVGSMLTAIAREAGGLTDAEAEQFDRLRDRNPAEPMRFECRRDAATLIHSHLTP